eukprot:CAMPEP_0202374874 /NCGR_PEP_ID=MMETSP1127-20130417/5623_1 /ASSEMBLY_ACC=CAM_ASM_000462 /TAXON_ID=3047 /ORGANISM="Dunaliella tertiolecta, Strain CCMP1320" /LENGTH=1176 /DNA_ID=CAMNT_0048972151 /DNA_START=96 /DNA_END=3626 /DNA_ORIENTATION=-
MAEAQQEPAGMSQLLRELEDSFQHDPQEEDTGRQLQLLLAFYDGHFVHAVHGEFSSKPMLDKLRKPNMQDGFEKLFVQVVCCLKRFQPNFEELRRDMQRHPWFSVPAPGTYFYKLGLQMDQQMALWYTCMRILHLIQCSSPYFFPRHHLGNIKGLALFRDLLVTFVAPSLRIKLNNQRGSLLPSTESPELAILCTGLHSKDLARTLRIQLMYFATHWDGCRPHEQGGLFCDLFVEGLMTIWEVALRKIGSRADAQQWQQQQQQQGERAANGDDACLGLEGLEFWQPAVDAAAWTAYVLIARRKFGVPIPHDFNRLLEVALATMQRVSLVPACGPKLPPGVAAAHVAVCALLERKEALMRANNFAVHGVALASSLRIQLNRCIADIHALLGTALPASSAAAAAPASVPAASNSSQAVQLVHQAAALLASACNFCPPSDLAITQRLANLDPQPDTPLKDSAKEVMKNFLLVNLGMLIEPMAELMLMLDAHPTKLRALVPDPLGLLLAQLKALSYSMVCSPWVTEKRDSNRWASAPPAVSQYCQATSTIAFHSDPLRLAIRAIGSCQHLLTPNAEPLSRRLPSRLAVASDVLKPLTKLHANLLWRTVMGHSCSVTSALWEEVRVFVINFIRITAPRVVSMQQQQQQQEAVKQEQKLQQEQEQQQQQQQQQREFPPKQTPHCQQEQEQQQKACSQGASTDPHAPSPAPSSSRTCPSSPKTSLDTPSSALPRSLSSKVLQGQEAREQARAGLQAPSLSVPAEGVSRAGSGGQGQQSKKCSGALLPRASHIAQQQGEPLQIHNPRPPLPPLPPLPPQPAPTSHGSHRLPSHQQQPQQQQRGVSWGFRFRLGFRGLGRRPGIQHDLLVSAPGQQQQSHALPAAEARQLDSGPSASSSLALSLPSVQAGNAEREHGPLQPSEQPAIGDEASIPQTQAHGGFATAVGKLAAGAATAGGRGLMWVGHKFHREQQQQQQQEDSLGVLHDTPAAPDQPPAVPPPVQQASRAMTGSSLHSRSSCKPEPLLQQPAVPLPTGSLRQASLNLLRTSSLPSGDNCLGGKGQIPKQDQAGKGHSKGDSKLVACPPVPSPSGQIKSKEPPLLDSASPVVTGAMLRGELQEDGDTTDAEQSWPASFRGQLQPAHHCQIYGDSDHDDDSEGEVLEASRHAAMHDLEDEERRSLSTGP